MARKLRIQYSGAIYHFINRGNYRRDVSDSIGAAQAFLRVLGEANAFYKKADGFRSSNVIILLL
jgi:putative transposase